MDGPKPNLSHICMFICHSIVHSEFTAFGINQTHTEIYIGTYRMNVKTNNQIVANRIDVALVDNVLAFLLTRTHKMILLLIYGFIFFVVFLLERTFIPYFHTEHPIYDCLGLANKL